MLNREVISGFIRIHVLHHAAHKPVFGVWLIEELREHGYKVGPGTLYPILHALEDVGYLKSKFIPHESKRRRVYMITSRGRKALERAKVKIKELYDELFEERLDDAGRNMTKRKVRTPGQAKARRH
jgi:PadR family transcriptional regulator, regulatory protein PadR